MRNAQRALPFFSELFRRHVHMLAQSTHYHAILRHRIVIALRGTRLLRVQNFMQAQNA